MPTGLPALQELLRYLRANGCKTYIVTGGGQDFVRTYCEQVYGIPPDQVVGTAGGVKYGYSNEGEPMLTKEPKLLLNDDHRLIGQFGVTSLPSWILGLLYPVLNLGVELVHGHAGQRGDQGLFKFL